MRLFSKTVSTKPPLQPAYHNVNGGRIQRNLLIVFLILALQACGRSESPAVIEFPIQSKGNIAITYPLNDTLFPPEIVAPTIRWEEGDSSVTKWHVLLRFPGESPALDSGNNAKQDDNKILRFVVEDTSWQPKEDLWSEIKRRSTTNSAEIAVLGATPNGVVSASQSVSFSTSIHPVGDSIYYREVPLPFIEAVQDPSRIRWRFGSIDSEQRPPVVLEDLPVCGNCHSFSGNGEVLGMDVDYGNDKGGYAILPVKEQMVLDDEKIITWSDYKRDDGESTFGLLSQVSPDGRYVISTVKDRAVFVATPGIEFSQLFFPIKGILVVYDTINKTYAPLPGADDPAYVQSNPTWSPDGKSVVFARSKVYEKASIANATRILLDEKDVPEFIEDNEPFKYDLYRVPFNEGRGGDAMPIEGASHNGKSNFFAKFSPDSKWIVFTQAENYMLLMPDSELFIIPAEGGEARRLKANTPRMNSWHSFSSNGKWLVFSSKANTPYTQLFLTHIDEQGNSTPPVVLERFTGDDRAANIPEFVPLPASAIAKIDEQFLDAYSFLRAGMANERTGKYPEAVLAYQRGLEAEPDNVELLNSLGFALFQQGKSDAAVDALEKALKNDPKHWKAHNNMALAAIDIGELELAEAHYRESLAIKPQTAIYNDLGFVLEQQGLSEEASDMYRESLELDPKSLAARYNFASTLVRSGQFDEAEKQFHLVIDKEPDAKSYTGLSIVLAEQGKLDESRSAINRALKIEPDNKAAIEVLKQLEAAANGNR